jgi:hypothetical protein
MPAPRKNSAPRGFLPPVVTARGGEHGMTYRSHKAHVQYWTGFDIPVEINSERLLSAYEAWDAASKDGVPRLRDIMTSAANAAVNDALLYLKVNDDFLVVSQGPDHVHHIGYDMRGCLLSEFDPAVSPVLKELYEKCLADQVAIYSRFASDMAPNSIYWEGLFLPLTSDEGGNVQFVMNYNTPIDSKADILQMIIDRAPVGLITAVPLGDSRGGIDGRIISVNARAKELLKFDENGSRVHYIHELAPWVRDIAGWTRTSVSTEGQKTCIHYRGKSNGAFSVTMEPFKRFILFSIAEIRNANAARLPGAAA